MKIGQFGESFIPVFDGVGRVMKAYAETMTSRGHEVYVIAPLYDTGYRGKYPYEIIDFTSIQLTKKMPWKVGIEQLDPHFNMRMKDVDLDICHVHGPAFAGHIGRNLAKKRNIPLVGTFHTKFYDDILETTRSKAIAKFGAGIVADFYESCDEVWAVSENSAETLREYGYHGKIFIMPNGSDKHTLKQEIVPSVKAKYKIREDVPVFLFVGQINFKKNIERIVQSCGLLAKEGQDFQLIFAGRGPDEEAVARLCKQCKIDDKVVFTGHLQDTHELDCLYYLADLFLFPSIYDNSPLVLRESAAMSTPGVVVEGTGTAEVVQDKVNGLLCKDTDTSLKEAIVYFLNLSKQEKEELGKKAFETIPVPWDGPLMDKVLERYQNLIDFYKFRNTK